LRGLAVIEHRERHEIDRLIQLEGSEIYSQSIGFGFQVDSVLPE
jgi:hypothetical protein